MGKINFASAIACISPTTGICANAPSTTAKIIVAAAGILTAIFVAWYFFAPLARAGEKKRSEEMPMDHMNH